MIKAEIEDKELAEYLKALPQDELIHFTLAEGRLRGAIFSGTTFVNQMRAQHKTGILETYILGQASLCGALLIPALMKGLEKISWRYDVQDSPAKGFNVDVSSTGWVRSYLLNDHIPIEKPLENWDMTPFLGGDGFMTIQRLHPDDKFPRSSSVNTSGNIADDLVFYFDKSEQLKTAFKTSIQMDKQGRVIGAGGIFLQVIPETGGRINGREVQGSQINTQSDQEKDEEVLEKVEKCFEKCPSLGKWFSEGRTCDELTEKLFKEQNPVIAVHRSVVYDCPCSKDYFFKYIKTLPAEEIKSMKDAGEVLEVNCKSCGSKYFIDPKEL